MQPQTLAPKETISDLSEDFDICSMLLQIIIPSSTQNSLFSSSVRRQANGRLLTLVYALCKLALRKNISKYADIWENKL